MKELDEKKWEKFDVFGKKDFYALLQLIAV